MDGSDLEMFLLSKTSRPALPPPPLPIQVVYGVFPGVKRADRELNHSPPSSAEVKKQWSYISTSLYAFIAWCLPKGFHDLCSLLSIVRVTYLNAGHCNEF